MRPVHEAGDLVGEVRAHLEFATGDARIGGLVLPAEGRGDGRGVEVIDDDDEVLHLRAIEIGLRGERRRNLIFAADFERRDLFWFERAVWREDGQRERWNEWILVIG